MKAVVAAFNQEKALVGAFSVITKLRMELFGALVWTHQNRGWTMEMNLSMATDTVAQIDPFRDIWRMGRSHGSRNGWMNI